MARAVSFGLLNGCTIDPPGSGRLKADFQTNTRLFNVTLTAAAQRRHTVLQGGSYPPKLSDMFDLPPACRRGKFGLRGSGAAQVLADPAQNGLPSST